MLADVLAALRCPICRESFTISEKSDTPGSLRCPHGHSYDRARQGYVNLLTGTDPGTGDDADMVARRAAFLSRGHYSPIADALPSSKGLIVEVGAGTGYYLAHVLDRSPEAVGLALDVSKYAARRAARAHPRAAAAVADCWSQLPLADSTVDVIVNVFAPRNPAEFARVLRPSGKLIVVTPLPEHLIEIREPLGMITVDPEKATRTAAALSPFFTLHTMSTVRRALLLDHTEVADLVGMGPSARHTHPVAQIAALPEPAAVTLSVQLGVYVPR